MAFPEIRQSFWRAFSTDMPSEPKTPFATYLLPSLSLPFRRRQQSTSSVLSDTAPSLSYSPTASPSSSPPFPYSVPVQGLLHAALSSNKAPATSTHLTAQPPTLKCSTCASDIAFASQIVSKGFTGRHGRAYLVAPPPRPPCTFTLASRKPKPGDLVNTKTGRNVNRELLTGQHVVADVSCRICETVLGWKYVDAKEEAQRYKIGKFILETKRVVMFRGWEESLVGEGEEGDEYREGEGFMGEDVVSFDSEDEDECDDLFAGIWDPEIAAKRRGRRVVSRKRDSSV